MHDKIKELWSQAGGHYDSGNQHTWPQYTIDNPEKFAELLIFECIKIAVFNGNHVTAVAIKEKFGVGK